MPAAAAAEEYQSGSINARVSLTGGPAPDTISAIPSQDLQTEQDPAPAARQYQQAETIRLKQWKSPRS